MIDTPRFIDEGIHVGGSGEQLAVAVDARLISGEYGGVEQVIIGLAHGLSGLKDGSERYDFLVYEGEESWLEPFVSGPCRLTYVPRPKEPDTWRHKAVRAAPRLAAMRRRLLGERRPGEQAPIAVPVSDGFIERAGYDLVHFTKQDGFLTEVPSIYHPHDLQHVHLPEFFSSTERARRDLWYRTLCEQASMIAVTSNWGSRDLVEHFGVDPGKIEVIPLAPALTAYVAGTPASRQNVLRTLGVERGGYLLYPAQTWPHKNHLRLIEAVVALRKKGIPVSLVCSGRLNDDYPALEEQVARLGASDYVRFLGFVSACELDALYYGARGLVMPTLFEAAGGFGPIAEAFAAGVPVACSNVTSLPEEVGDAALVFDPLNTTSIAEAVERLWCEEPLRTELVAKGVKRVSTYSWTRVALTFRAHYRRICGRSVTEEDTSLMSQLADY